MNKVKLLVVDDEETLCEALRFNLEEAGYEVDVAYSAEEALTLRLRDYSLILLDIMMGEMSGTRLATILKKSSETASIPIIFCTARDDDADMIAGLDLGADDYITKPYSIGNVLARVRSVLRRVGRGDERSQPDGDIAFEGIEISGALKSCTVDGKDVRMPRKEFEMLSLMMRNRGRVFSREELLRNIWPDEVVVLDRVIDVNIRRLRAKLGPYGHHIITRSGYGYGFVD